MPTPQISYLSKTEYLLREQQILKPTQPLDVTGKLTA